MQAEGIARENTTQATPQQNGVAERRNRTLADGVTTMLSEAKLPLAFWGEALQTYNFLLNILLSSTLNGSITSFELWNGYKPDYSHLRIFGCRAFVHIQGDQCKSLQPKTNPCIFQGYPDDYKGWKCWDPRSR
jgi:hypothetical protein